MSDAFDADGALTEWARRQLDPLPEEQLIEKLRQLDTLEKLTRQLVRQRDEALRHCQELHVERDMWHRRAMHLFDVLHNTPVIPDDATIIVMSLPELYAPEPPPNAN